MERDFIRSDSLMETEFVTNPDSLMHYHENIELMYIMSGGMKYTIEDREILMKEGDLAIVNASRQHACRVEEETLIFRVIISNYQAAQLTGKNPVLFHCNSASEGGAVYDEIRMTLIRLIDAVVKDEYGRAGASIYVASLYYLLLHQLVSSFMVEAAAVRSDRSDEEDRIADIFAYIRLNYRNSISLQDLADHLFLSPTYVSKYISRKCGISFVDLLNSVRLTHATEELIYTDNYVMKIAMDNGFASVAAFNKVFREAQNMTPSEFRNSLKKNRKGTIQSDAEAVKIRNQVKAFIEAHPADTAPEEDVIYTNTSVDVSRTEQFGWSNPDMMITHIGSAANLLRTSFQEQLLMAKERIGIRYVCFWGLFSPDLNLSVHVKDGRWSFRGLDVILDFLVQNGMKPYIELSFKPDRLLKNTKEALKERSAGEDFDSEEEMERFFRSFMQHLVRRFGEDEIEHWFFDYQEREKLSFDTLSFRYYSMSDDDHEEYFRKFDLIDNAFRSVTERFCLGGGEFPLQHYGEEGFSHILKIWNAHTAKPAFLTITSFPYEIQNDGKYYFEKRTTNPDFVRRGVEAAKRCIRESGFKELDLHVMEYGMTLSNRSAINDSCSKGSFVMKTVIDSTAKVSMLGHFMFTDVYSDYHDVFGLLFGGSGLLTINGIPKPSFYAYEFLNSLYPTVIDRGNNYLVTTNGRGSYRIVCHSHRELGYQFFMGNEDDLKIKDVWEVDSDKRKEAVSFVMSGVRNGVYHIRKKSINRENGSIQDEWVRLNMDPDLTQSDYEYLRNMSTPRLSIADIIAKDGTLTLVTELTPNEIQLISVVPV